MKHHLRKLLSMMLCLTLVAGMTVPAFAANESNDQDITFSASLDKGELTVSQEVQTVEMTIKASSPVTLDGIGMKVTCDDELTLTSVNGGETAITMTDSNYTADKSLATYGTVAWNADSDISNVTNLVVVVFTVPANTPAGTYTVGAESIELTADAEVWEETASVSATLTITDGQGGGETTTSAYTASVSTETETVDNNVTSKVLIDVTVGGTTGKFNSAEIKLSYDPELLTFENGTCNLTATDMAENATDQDANYIVAKTGDEETGTLTIRDFGGKLVTGENGEKAYTLTFSTLKGGETGVSLTSAGFSTEEEAETKDLTYVTSTNSANVTINHKATITEEDGTPTVSYVTPDGTYEGNIPDYDPDNNTYDITVKIDGVEQDDPEIDEEGNFSISPVDGELEITYKVIPNEYTVDWIDKDSVVTNKNPGTSTVTHGTNITFDVPVNVQPNGTKPGTKYTVKVTQTDDPETEADESENVIEPGSTASETEGYLTYTIDGDDISFDITITVEMSEIPANMTTITIDSDVEIKKDGQVVSGEIEVAKKSTVTLTLTKEPGHIYKVKQTVGTTTTTLEVAENGSFNVFVGDDPVTIKVSKTLDTSTLAVSHYVTLDGTNMWLVKIGNAKIDDYTYTYKADENTEAKNLFWSSQYNAYCYLVIDEENPYGDNVSAEDKAAFAAKFGLTNTDAIAISYSGNINGTTKDNAAVIDVNDAQLVWNMYSVVYNSFSNDVTIQKFLEADMNASGTVDSTDAQAVVAKLS